MSLELALQRIQLGHKLLGYIPEWLSECYLNENQIRELDLSHSTRLKQILKIPFNKVVF